MRKEDIITAFARFVLSALFAYAGWQKVMHPVAFAENIEAFQFVPALGISLLALSLPVLELLTAAALILNSPRRVGLLSAAILSALFTGALGIAVSRGLEIDCGCFGSADPAAGGSTVAALIRAIVLLLVALALYVTELRRHLRSSLEMPT